MTSEIEWSDLHARFRSLADKTGAEKVSSYALDISFDPPTGDIRIHMGTYDIGDWPRHTYLGPFKTEIEAKLATLNKIEQAEAAVSAEAND